MTFLRSVVLITALAIANGNLCLGQESEGSLLVGMPSPNAAALGKFGDVPVGIHTGTPSINIPIVSASGKSLSLPISLDYHASGIKVEDIPGWVGLGWALNAGGVIVRSMRGLPDDGTNGYLFTGQLVEDHWDDIPYNVPNGLPTQWADGSKDPEPDQFFFNFAGYSGKFVLSPDGQVNAEDNRTLPYKKIKIEFDSPVVGSVWGVNVKHIPRWVVTVEDGTRYVFEQIEATNLSTPYAFGLYKYVSSWYLTRIESAGGDDAIYFSYSAPEQASYEMQSFHERYFKMGGDCEVVERVVNSNYQVNSIYLESITTSKTNTLFYSNEIGAGGKGRRLDEIRIESITDPGSLIREFELSYGSLAGRLSLISVVEKGSDGTEKPPFSFEYDQSITLPSRTGFDKDHWGYYNGKSNATPIPTHYGGPSNFFLGANREPDPSYTNAGVLTKVTYPTGGTSEFVYESHDFGRVSGNLVSWGTGSIEFAYAASFGVSSSGFDNFEVVDASGFSTVVVTLDVTLNLSGGWGGQYVNKSLIKIVRVNDDLSEETVFDQRFDVNTMTLDPDDIFPPDELTYHLPLAGGNYRLEAYSWYDFSGPGDVTTVSASWKNLEAMKTRIGGGVRVKEVRSHDGISIENDVVRKYEYVLSSEPDRSSGCLVTEPKYDYYFEGIGCAAISLSSSSKLPLGTSQGSYVGYIEVKEIFGENESSGYLVHTFTAANTYPDYYYDNGRWPGTLSVSGDWKRGLPLSKKEFNSADQPVLETTYTYSIHDDPDPISKSFKAVSARKTGQSEVPGNPDGEVVLFKYRVISGWLYQSSETKSLFDQDGQNPITTVKVFKYDNPDHLQITGTEETNSDGTKRISEITYAHEIPEYSGMANVNMITQVAQRTVYENTVFTGNAKLSSVTTWKEWQPGKWSEKGSYAWRDDDSPPSLAVFDGWLTDPSESEWIANEIVETVDDFGRPTSVKDAMGVPSSVIWGHDKTVPIATVRNAGYGSHIDGWPRGFSYSGFESHNGLVFDGGWSRAGQYSTVESYTGTGSARVSTLDNGPEGPTMDFRIQDGLDNNTTYVVSCWVKTNSANAEIVACKNNSSDYVIKGTNEAIREINGWKLIEFEYPHVQGWMSTDYMRVYPSNNNTTPGYFDDIRVYPKGALVISQTYDTATLQPTSRCDENSVPVSRYVFDDFQRLIEIKDAFELSRSKYGYHYRTGSGDRNYIKGTIYPNGNQGEPAITKLTYFDDLGKEMQVLANNEVGDGSVVMHTFYNTKGLPVVKTKPVEVLPSDIQGYQTLDFVDPLELVDSLSFLGASDVSAGKLLTDKTGDARAYQKINYLLEPGSRSSNVKPFGKDFHSDGHFLKTSYWTKSLENLVYARQEDEDGDIREDYFDFFGNTVRQVTDMEQQADLVTLFDYDVSGNLLSSTAPNSAVTAYDYNTLNQVISKTSTDEGTIEYLYDKAGRLRLVQDQNHKVGFQFAGNTYSWTFFKYDALGRMIQQGEYRNTAGYSPSAMQGFLDDDGTLYQPHEAEGGNQSFPKETADMLYTTYQYYDEYSFANAPFAGSDLVGPFSSYNDNAVGGLTKTLTLEPATGDFLEEVYFYDVYGRITTKLVYIPEIGAKEIGYSYDVSGRITKLSYQKGDPDESFFQWFEYDNLSRIRDVYSHTVDDKYTAVREAQYEYDDTNGKVRTLILGDGVQTVDYVYNIRDWLTGINDPNNLGGDKFGMILSYYDSDAGSASPARYDGNIRSAKWKTEGQPMAGYDYTYDLADRLLHGDFQDANKYSERAISYDPAGNILSLTRYADGVPATLSYQYDDVAPKPNRLLSVSGGLNANYVYDGNGNMTVDDSKGDFIYDYRNMPVQIDLNGTGQSIILSYDAAGQRYRKLVRDSGGSLEPGSRLYVRGIGDNIVAEYAPAPGSWSVDHFNLYGMDLIGKIQMVPGTLQLKDGSLNGTQAVSAEDEIVVEPEFDINGEVALEVGVGGIEGRYHYLKDHLGSVRAVLDDEGNVQTRSDYYPFGADHGTNTWTFNTNERFTGKQLDESLELIYFGARYFSPIIGRWSSVDPLDEKYADLSPYHYSLNNPVNYYDPDGNYVVSDDGKTARRTGLDDARFRALGEVSAYWQALSILIRELEADPSDMALPIEYASATFGVFGGLSVRGAKRALKMSGNFLASFGIDYGRFSISRMFSAAIEKEIDNIDALYMDQKTFEVAEKVGMGTFKFRSNEEVLEISDEFLAGISNRGSKAAIEVTKTLEEITGVLQGFADNNGFDLTTAGGRDGFSDFLKNKENMTKVLEGVQSLK